MKRPIVRVVEDTDEVIGWVSPPDRVIGPGHPLFTAARLRVARDLAFWAHRSDLGVEYGDATEAHDCAWNFWLTVARDRGLLDTSEGMARLFGVRPT